MKNLIPILILATQDPVSEAPSLPDSEQSETQRVEDQIEELRQRLRRSEEARQREVSPLTLNGYIDFGFFVPIGNDGVGWVRDTGNRAFPQHGNFAWTFLGDILGTPVNTRGEAADLGDAPGIERFDSVDSDGAPGFILNEVNMRVGYQLARRALLRSSVNFTPRTARQDFSQGDFVDVDVGELEVLVTEDGGTSVFVGKTLPVFGIEYKDRKSDRRFGITPSLVDRYTSGPQLGAKIRSKLFADWLIVAAAISNNNSTVEPFHFYREIDRNSGKTVSARLALSVPLPSGHRLEIGASGEWGSQDGATDNAGKIWFAGLDLQYLGTDFALKAQAIRGGAPGRADQRVWGLELDNSGFVELDWQLLPFVGIMARIDARDALVTLAMERAYVTKQLRFTGGLRFVFGPHIALKSEVLHSREFGGVPEFTNDMFTSSLVLSY